MRFKTLLALLTLAALIAACTGEQSSLVTTNGAAPYYTNLAEAQAAARADQHIVVDFYTDW